MNESKPLDDDKLYQLHLELSARLARELIETTTASGGEQSHILVTLGSLVCFVCAATYGAEVEGTPEHMMETLFEQCRERMTMMQDTIATLRVLASRDGGTA